MTCWWTRRRTPGGGGGGGGGKSWLTVSQLGEDVVSIHVEFKLCRDTVVPA